jgi:ubiquinone/menaquinone biosynthesis C-methylase UbiE
MLFYILVILKKSLVSLLKYKKKFFPYFTKSLIGIEKNILDFGCGVGRFTPDLANLIKGTAIGIDPIKNLLKKANQQENVTYLLMKDTQIPLPNESVDITWICLVLGGINDVLLQENLQEIERVLKKDGLLFMVENTSNYSNTNYWYYRSVEEYQSLVKFATIEHLSTYFDQNESISIFAGRKY